MYGQVIVNNKEVGIVSSFVLAKNQTNIINQSLDGAFYIQSVGDISQTAQVSVNVTYENRLILMEAFVNVDLITVTYKGITYFGYLSQAPQNGVIYPGQWYSAAFTLLIEGVSA